ncbi:MAG: hypothetical protein Q8M08_03055 [Bacteroidales bacterium]|nr:hypothetical protein [Bacteroidales bacterium]
MYKLVFQKNMTVEKWSSFPRLQQLLMIANELNRAQNALEKGDIENAIHAWERAFELTDLTVEDKKNVRLLKELLRFREMMGENFISHDTFFNKALMNGLIQMDPAAYSAMC